MIKQIKHHFRGLLWDQFWNYFNDPNMCYTGSQLGGQFWVQFETHLEGNLWDQLEESNEEY